MRCIKSFVVCLFSAAGLAFGQVTAEVSPQVGFDCWIGEEGKPFHHYYIRCIAPHGTPTGPETEADYNLAVERLHEEFHNGSGARTEAIYKSHIGLIQEAGGVWSIRIFSYPSDWSWADGTPERLVRAALCPTEGSCQVSILKH